MIFSLISFLCVFLPIVFILYYLMPNIRAKNFLLIFASFLFYSVGEPIYVLILFGSTVMNYLFGRLIASFSTRSKIWAGTGIAFNIILLGVFKYLDFVIDSFNSIITFQTNFKRFILLVSNNHNSPNWCHFWKLYF